MMSSLRHLRRWTRLSQTADSYSSPAVTHTPILCRCRIVAATSPTNSSNAVSMTPPLRGLSSTPALFLATSLASFNVNPRMSAEEIRENLYNPYSVAEKPEDAKELEPPVRYFLEDRFYEPDYGVSKEEALKMYEKTQPADLYTDFEESTEEWTYVERLLGNPVISPPPPHPSYPTPSGWSPPNPDLSLEWFVRRKKDHHLDVDVEDLWLTKCGAPGQGFSVTSVGGIEGDVWAFVKAAREYLRERLPPPQRAWQRRRPMEVEFRVDEYEGRVTFKGIWDKHLTDFLLMHGM